MKSPEMIPGSFCLPNGREGIDEMAEFDWESDLPNDVDDDETEAETNVMGDDSDAEDADIVRRRQLLKDQVELGGPMAGVYAELLVALDERVAKQKAEAAAARLIESEPALDIYGDPAVQEALRIDMARMRAEADARLLAEFTRQWTADGLDKEAIASKVAELKAQQEQLAEYETGNAGSRFDGPTPMLDHPLWQQAKRAAWEAERGVLGAAEFSGDWDEVVAQAEAEMRVIIERDAARR